MKFDFVVAEGPEGKAAVDMFKRRPVCGKMHSTTPAISADGATEICKECKEAENQ